jgi:hypothetical protein
MKQIAVIGLIMIIVLFPSCKWLKKMGFLGKNADTMAVWLAKQDSIRVSDSLKAVQSRLLALENARLDSIRKVEKAQSDFEGRFKYNIILGSFITPEYARRFSADLAKMGFRTRLINLAGTKFEMVSAEAHDNLRDALTRLKQFQDTVSPDAWIYINNKKQ